MKYKSFVCAKCFGIMLADTPRSLIAGRVYHIRCGTVALQEKLIKDLDELTKELKSKGVK